MSHCRSCAGWRPYAHRRIDPLHWLLQPGSLSLSSAVQVWAGVDLVTPQPVQLLSGVNAEERRQGMGQSFVEAGQAGVAIGA